MFHARAELFLPATFQFLKFFCHKCKNEEILTPYRAPSFVTLADMEQRGYEVLIIGGGISGATLLYDLALHSDVQSMCLIEKYDHLDPLNSNAHSNSQTLHCGDIETNYNREKADHVRGGADMMLQFVNNGSGDPTLKRNYGKMLLGVGDEEVATVKERFESIAKDS